MKFQPLAAARLVSKISEMLVLVKLIKMNEQNYDDDPDIKREKKVARK